MNETESLYWAAMLQVPGVGPKTFLKLKAVLESLSVTVKDFWFLSEKELTEIELPLQLISSFLSFRSSSFSIENFQAKLANENIKLLASDDTAYPFLLSQIPNYPPLLYVKGDISILSQKPMAIVGTRRVTSYGRMVTEKFTRELVQYGYTIVSGFMYGVDAIAHQTALEANGKTVGVLGFGFDFMFPSQHAQLAQRLLEKGGTLITEFPPHIETHPGNFPLRNRIVAGLSSGVLVAEAAKESGSKITAQYAGEYGREVFSVSGAITSKYAEGTKDLVNSGAKLVTCVEDILEELEGEQVLGDRGKVLDILDRLEFGNDRTIVELLLVREMEVDELVSELKLSIAEIGSRLTMLELQGVVRSEGGKYWVII